MNTFYLQECTAYTSMRKYISETEEKKLNHIGKLKNNKNIKNDKVQNF
jgi:hypothetical protein